MGPHIPTAPCEGEGRGRGGAAGGPPAEEPEGRAEEEGVDEDGPQLAGGVGEGAEAEGVEVVEGAEVGVEGDGEDGEQGDAPGPEPARGGEQPEGDHGQGGQAGAEQLDALVQVDRGAAQDAVLVPGAPEQPVAEVADRLDSRRLDVARRAIEDGQLGGDRQDTGRAYQDA